MQAILDKHDGVSTIQVQLLRKETRAQHYQRVNKSKDGPMSSSKLLMSYDRDSESSRAKSKSESKRTTQERACQVIDSELQSTTKVYNAETTPRAEKSGRYVKPKDAEAHTKRFSGIPMGHNPTSSEPTFSVLKHIDQQIRRLFGFKRKQGPCPTTSLQNDVRFRFPKINAPPLPKPTSRVWRPQSIIEHSFPEESEREIQEYLQKNTPDRREV